MRPLMRDEVKLLWTVDRSEVHHHTYEVRKGQLVRVPHYFEIPGWRSDAAAKETPVLLDRFDRGGTFVGVFDAGTLIGMSVLESARVGRSRDQVQLASLYVSRSFAGAASGCSSSRRRWQLRVSWSERALRLGHTDREHCRLLPRKRLCTRA